MGQLWQSFTDNSGRDINKFPHYFPIYERHFRRFVDRSVNVLEIGVWRGGSLHMWKKYFGPLSTIVGIDIDPQAKVHEAPEEGVHVEIGDQSDNTFLDEVVSKYGPFDIIIDDGSHIAEHTVASFRRLYDRVTKDGVYLVEDLHTAYSDGWNGGLRREGTFIELTKDLIDELHAYRTKGQLEATPFTRSTDSINIYESVVVFEKARRVHRKSVVRGGGQDHPQPTIAAPMAVQNDKTEEETPASPASHAQQASQAFALDDFFEKRHAVPPRISMKHFVLTRFAMTTGFSTDDMLPWLEHRIPIFEDVCLPSMVQQKVVPDFWLIGFDERYRDALKRVLELIAPYPWIVPVWQGMKDDAPEGWSQPFQRHITAEARGKIDYVVTTRTDNDDALNLHFVEAVNENVQRVIAATNAEDFWLAFPYGIQASDDDMRMEINTAPHFMSRCSTTGHYLSVKKTALSGNHAKVHEDGSPVFLPPTKFPMWLEYVHGKNWINEIGDYLPTIGPRKKVLSHFGLMGAEGQRPRGS